MPRKKGSKSIWIDGAIHAAIRDRLKAERWTWGVTKKVESILRNYVTGIKESLPRERRHCPDGDM